MFIKITQQKNTAPYLLQAGVLAALFLTTSISTAAAQEVQPEVAPTTILLPTDELRAPEVEPTDLLIIDSPIYTDTEAWYSNVNGLFTFHWPSAAVSAAIAVVTNPDTHPEDQEGSLFATPPDAFVLDSTLLHNGVQYLSVSYQDDEGDWSNPLLRKIKIDLLPPEQFAVTMVPRSEVHDVPMLRYQTTDTQSGVAYYEMRIADSEPVRVDPDKAQSGYELSLERGRIQSVRVLAVDVAGNKRESTTVLLFDGNSTLKNHRSIVIPTEVYGIIGILLVLLIVGSLYFHKKHTRMKAREEMLRHEVLQIKDQMEKIFSALRDEVYEQINKITKRKKLSAKEAEAVEALTQSLSVSKSLIEKEVTDVQKVLE